MTPLSLLVCPRDRAERLAQLLASVDRANDGARGKFWAARLSAGDDGYALIGHTSPSPAALPAREPARHARRGRSSCAGRSPPWRVSSPVPWRGAGQIVADK